MGHREMGQDIDHSKVTKQEMVDMKLIPSSLNNHTRGTRKRGRLTGGVRNRVDMAQQQLMMAAFWRDGVSYAEIAERVSDNFNLEGDHRFSVSAVSYHIKELLKFWREKGLVHMDERQAMVLARYDQIEVLATEAYFASCRGKKTTFFDRTIERTRSDEYAKKISKRIRKDREERLSEKRKAGAQPISPLKDPRIPFQENGEIEDILIVSSEKIKEYVRREENLAGDPRFLGIIVDINDKRAKLFGLGRREIMNGDQELARLPDEQREKRLASVITQVLRRSQGLGDLADPAPLGGFIELPEGTDVPVPSSAGEPDLSDFFDMGLEEEVEDAWKGL